jgi:hypothetical protein
VSLKRSGEQREREQGEQDHGAAHATDPDEASASPPDPSLGPSPFGLMIRHIFRRSCERLAVI